MWFQTSSRRLQGRLKITALSFSGSNWRVLQNLNSAWSSSVVSTEIRFIRTECDDCRAVPSNSRFRFKRNEACGSRIKFDRMRAVSYNGESPADRRLSAARTATILHNKHVMNAVVVVMATGWCDSCYCNISVVVYTGHVFRAFLPSPVFPPGYVKKLAMPILNHNPNRNPWCFTFKSPA